MLKSLKTMCLACGALCAAAVGNGTIAWAQEAAIEPVIAQETDKVGDVLFLLANEEEEEKDDGEYWLGIGLARLPELAKQQLGLEGGLVVEDVAAESPAAKAEIKRLDILIKAGDATLNEPADLVKSVEKAKETALTITAVRSGKQVTLNVTPAKRPKSDGPASVLRTLRARVPEVSAEIKAVEAALEKLKAKTGGAEVQLLFPKPAVVAPRVEVKKSVDLPKNMTVRITKEGDQPAKIFVKTDKQEWEITEDKLSELPEDVRKHVQQYLNRPHAYSLQFTNPPTIAAARTRIANSEVKGEIRLTPPVPPQPPKAAAPAKAAAPLEYVPGTAPQTARLHYRIAGDSSSQVESKLDAIMKKLDQLQKDVDELRSEKK